jgi:hypothetical protein
MKKEYAVFLKGKIYMKRDGSKTTKMKMIADKKVPVHEYEEWEECDRGNGGK